jgi:hypothetical protein
MRVAFIGINTEEFHKIRFTSRFSHLNLFVQDWSEVNVLAEDSLQKKFQSQISNVLFDDPSLRYEAGLNVDRNFARFITPST